jgi:regulator of nonsense transcripts 3
MNKDKDQRPRTKVVVRHLPAGLTQEAFRSAIEPFFSNVEYFYFSPGKVKIKGTRPAVAWLAFKEPAQAQEFMQQFNGHTFVDSKGMSNKL